ncbi:hypothetical protein B7C42_05506 [Nocardia cerradoensis]|uniref:Plasmid replication, integration and excision activator n=1 Tax=Nocardia cerradoensis TaxID=85688 RepID=A0A231H0E0_9NOCA|nr:hypothetical protein [Nocardia cerradoensis]OXR42307.1 hypothetical protein B7C42_05506 [Nocardia cerradoensis]
MPEYDTNFTRKDLRIPIDFSVFFGAGLYQMGPVRLDREYTGNPDRPGAQRRDEVTELPQWKISVMDPGESNARRTGYEIVLLSDKEPVPTTAEIGPNLRPIELTGLTIQPRVAGQGEYKYQSYMVRATGYASAPSTGGRGSSSGAGKSASES